MLALMAIALFVAAALGCNPSTGDPAAENGMDLTADEVLARTRAAMSSVDSYRFETTTLFLFGSEWEGSGAWVAPDRYHATYRGAEVIVLDDASFYRPLDRQEWTRFEPPDSQRPPWGEFLQIPDMTEVRFLPSVENGAHKLEGIVVHPHVQSPRPFRTRVTLTVNDQDFRIKEMTLWQLPEHRESGAFCSLNPEAWGEEWPEDCPHQSITYFDYDQEIQIEPPDVER